MLNHIIIMGRLTRDPELRYTQSQTPVASFSLAVDRDFKNQDGSKDTDFIDCVAWRATAEFVSKYFTKGSMAVVSGRLQLRDWTDRDGGKRRSAEVVADNVYFGESKRDNAGGGQPSAQGGYGAPGGYGPQGGYTPPPPAGSYGGGQYGAQQPQYQQPPYQPGYPPSNYGSGLHDAPDDGELPF